MTKETNIIKCKEASKMLFDIAKIKISDMFEILVNHPFTNCLFVPSNSLRETFLDLSKDSNLKSFREQCFNRIDKANTAFSLYTLIDKRWRLTWLKIVKEHLSQQDFSVILANAWTTSERPSADVNVSAKELIKWFRSADKKFLMEKRDLNIYNRLPKEFEIYRGVSSESRNPYGLSWTRERKTAQWFKDRFGRDGFLLKTVIKKENVLAYFNTRNEKEIVVDMNSVEQKHIERIVK